MVDVIESLNENLLHEIEAQKQAIDILKKDKEALSLTLHGYKQKLLVYENLVDTFIEKLTNKGG